MKNKFLKQHSKRNNGFTLVETLVAVSIFTMSILGLLIVLSNGIADTSYAKQKMVATYLAQDGIEYVRNLRDNAFISIDTNAGETPSDGWKRFLDTYAPNSGNGNFIEHSINDPDYNGFARNIRIEKTGGTTDEVLVTSTVSWNQGSGTKSVSFSESLFNWVESN